MNFLSTLIVRCNVQLQVFTNYDRQTVNIDMTYTHSQATKQTFSA